MEHTDEEGDLAAGAVFDPAWRQVLTETLPTTQNVTCCPKCGYHDTKMSYCDSGDRRPPALSMVQNKDNQCVRGHSEHFHRRCYRCDYQWRTDDVLTAASST
jgi:hypothetical protein